MADGGARYTIDINVRDVSIYIWTKVKIFTKLEK